MRLYMGSSIGWGSNLRQTGVHSREKGGGGVGGLGIFPETTQLSDLKLQNEVSVHRAASSVAVVLLTDIHHALPPAPPPLISGLVESQTDNRTNEELSKFKGKLEQLANQTISQPTKNNSTIGADLYKELELEKNQTLTVITEDDGLVVSQTHNRINEDWSKFEGKLEQLGNQTISPPTKNNSTIGADLYKEFELEKNQTLTVITEDDERFQDADYSFPHLNCQTELQVFYSHRFCGEAFHQHMMNITSERWCVLENVIRLYNDLTLCLENVSTIVGCFYPNSNIQDFFLYIHSLYFQNCSKEEEPFVDAPHSVVVILTLIPVSLIPVMVFLVVWRSKVQD
ncbi:uncharacterized protein LOC117530576 [Thalassophryne amazonica]|uniref:uncharacterized protein LOC117530576 n=1 Tax=Thalassophryne amazonica TaxID=390379 RepID=UPI001470FF4C|nr:uncharacterized protein LOC117530576 [Thalassophryne amazonica]